MSNAMLEAGVAHKTDRLGRTHRFAYFMAKLRRHEPVKVVAFGASITASHKRGGSAAAPPLHELAWHQQLMSWLRKAFPPAHGEHKLFVMAKGGTDSCFTAKRIVQAMSDAGKGADLAVLEFGVNDGWRDWQVAGSQGEQEETQLCFEACTRTLLQLSSSIAVVHLEFTNADTGGGGLPKTMMGEAMHRPVSQFYGVPVLSWRAAIASGVSARRKMCAKSPPLCRGSVPKAQIDSPMKYFCACRADDGPDQLARLIWYDGTHPRVWGHTMVVDLFVHLAEVALTRPDKALSVPQSSTNGHTSVVRLMSEVDVAFNKDFYSSKWCKLKPKRKGGWRCYEDVPTKPGWISDAADEAGGLSIAFDVTLTAGRYTVSLGYLRSYAKMGRFSCTVRDTSTGRKTTVELDGHWERRVSLLQNKAVAEVTGSFTLSIKTRPLVALRKGNKVKIQSITAVRGHWLPK